MEITRTQSAAAPIDFSVSVKRTPTAAGTPCPSSCSGTVQGDGGPHRGSPRTAGPVCASPMDAPPAGLLKFVQHHHVGHAMINGHHHHHQHGGAAAAGGNSAFRLVTPKAKYNGKRFASVLHRRLFVTFFRSGDEKNARISRLNYLYALAVVVTF